MAHGIVMGTKSGGGDVPFVSIEWDPAKSSPSDAVIEFCTLYPDAEFFAVVETQCDGTIRPVAAGEPADMFTQLEEATQAGSKPTV